MVTRLDLHLTVAGEGHAVQGGHILTLRAGRDNDELVLRDRFDLVQVDKRVFGEMEVIQLRCDLQDVLHAAARDGDLAAVAVGDVEHGLDAVHVRGERRDDDAVLAALEVAVKTLGHDGLRRGVTLTLDVRRVAQQGVDALLAEHAEAAEVRHAVLRRGVDLEVARHDDGADWRMDGKGHGIGNGMVHMDELHGEAARLHDVAGVMGHELRLAHKVVLLELELDEAQRQRRGVHGGIDGLQHIRQRADVVLVAVGDEEAAELLLVFRKIGDVRNDKVHAVHVVLGEAEAAVDDDHVLAVFQHGHVLADLIQTAERNDLQFFYQ